MKAKDFYCIIGFIDATGAIHHKGIKLGEQNTHSDYWPGMTHKTWRFVVSKWQLDDSVFSKDKLTQAEAEDVIAFIRKHYQAPLWVLEGEEWEALGRPHFGKAYEKHVRKWDKLRNDNNNI